MIAWCRDARKRLRRRSSFRVDTKGATAVEMALLAWPTFMLILGILQLVFIQNTQALLNDAVHDSGAKPEAELLLGSAGLYKQTLCGRMIFMGRQTCIDTVKVELMPLTSAPKAETPISGATFQPGLPNEAMLLRAALPVIKLVPFIPQFTARSSVVFRRT